tara:strand:- start:3074 stop:3838 length:765 start_codon:yes stop_codon:yes gene_type:complete
MSKTKEIKAPQWEIKDRTYLLANGLEPLTYTLQSKHHDKSSLLWFDENLKTQRELRYATNQNSPFVDEQKGECTLGHIIFHNGTLNVKKEQQNLQRLLSLYHPKREAIFKEFKPEVEAVDELAWINYEIDALNSARNIEIDHAEAILRVEKGTAVSEMSSKEIKRDLMIMAKRNPQAFLEIAKDENVGLRNVAIKAVEQQVLKLSQDQRTMHWGSNDRKLFNIPFDENPYSATAAWFKTDEGVEVFKQVEKKLQ